MKLLLIAMVLSLSTPAFADYFACELVNGFIKTEAEAEYRVREVSITERPFACHGRLLSDARVSVTISSTEVSYSVTEIGRGTVSAELTSLDVHGDGQDTGTCTCGLR